VKFVEPYDLQGCKGKTKCYNP